jgi:hypothetical protein
VNAHDTAKDLRRGEAIFPCRVRWFRRDQRIMQPASATAARAWFAGSSRAAMRREERSKQQRASPPAHIPEKWTPVSEKHMRQPEI